MSNGCQQLRPQCEVPVTLGKAYDEEIKEAKRRLESLVIAKAKADTLGMLDYPCQELRQILGHVI